MRAATRELLRRFAVYSTASHTRSLPNRGPCLLVPRTDAGDTRGLGRLLGSMYLHDRWEDVGRSVVQLVLGTYMTWDARRLRLCERYFETQLVTDGAADGPSLAPTCPVTGHGRSGANQPGP
jgi:hypothetical protein